MQFDFANRPASFSIRSQSTFLANFTQRMFLGKRCIVGLLRVSSTRCDNLIIIKLNFELIGMLIGFLFEPRLSTGREETLQKWISIIERRSEWCLNDEADF